VIDLATFLLARVAEKEHAADRATMSVMNGTNVWSALPSDMREWIHMNTPARGLAECEALRRIIENVAAGDFPIAVGFYLAQPYAAHPDFDPAWRL